MPKRRRRAYIDAVWVVEIQHDGSGLWGPCVGIGLTRKIARVVLDDWQRRNPDDAFRLRQYVRKRG